MKNSLCLAGMLIASCLNGTPRIADARVPLSFEPNRGQAVAEVDWISRGAGYGLFINSQGATVALSRDSRPTPQFASVRLDWMGAREVKGSAEQQISRKSNYFYTSKRINDVPHFSRVRYREIYRGIDIVYYGKEGEIEYDLLVAPGADSRDLKLRLVGEGEVRFADGDLVVSTGLGEVRHRKPFAYQEIGGEKRVVAAAYRRLPTGEIGFELGNYDRTRLLVIDPVITYATVQGGIGSDSANGISVDSAGNAYITGSTTSTDWPLTTGTYKSTQRGGLDAFIMKLNPAGTAIVYSTYFGGTGDDIGHQIAVDSNGAVWVAGQTSSTNLPLTFSQSYLGGVSDGFAIRLSADGTALQFSAYLGGNGEDVARAVVVAPDRRAFITGHTTSQFILGVDRGRTDVDSFIFTVDPTAAAVTFTGFRGGTGDDYAYAITRLPSGNIVIGGQTQGTATAGTSLQAANAGGTDGFLAAFSNNSTTFVYWAYVGGSGNDAIYSLSTDPDGNIYAAGSTQSANFPLASPIDNTLGGTQDGFVTKLNSSATARLFSTYVGGSGVDVATAVAVDSARSVYAGGMTQSSDFPQVDSIKRTSPGQLTDGFVVKLNSAGNAIVYSTLLGGSGNDRVQSLDTLGEQVFVAGYSESTDLPGVAPNSVRARDAMIYKLGSTCGAYIVAPTQANVGSGGGILQFQVTATAGCYWTAASGSEFGTITAGSSGLGNGTVNIQVAANATAQGRAIGATIAGTGITINQAGSTNPPPSCSVQLNTSSVSAPAAGSVGELTITTASNCTWVASSNASWLIVSPISGTGSRTIGYTIAPNFRPEVRSTTVNINDKVFTVTQALNPLNADQRFVQLLYFSFLGRTPAQSEIDHWVNQVNLGGQKRYAEVALGFLNSQEFALGGRFVAGLYVGILARNAEFRGWVFQRDALARRWVADPEALASNFVNSPEYALTFGNPTPEQYIRLLYQNILLRNPSDEEVAGWVKEMVPAGPASRAFIAVSFLRSNEFITKVGPRLTAFLLYATLLQRDPTQAEMDLRMSQLANITQDGLRALIAEFINSSEFRQVVGW